MALARMRAAEVLPTPLGPENRYAWAILPEEVDFLRLVATKSCPASWSKMAGLILVAVTVYDIFYSIR